MSIREQKFLSIPDGLSGERIDSALARLLGLSRSVIVSLIEADEITINRKIATKSDRVMVNDQIEVLLPEPVTTSTLTATPIENLEVLHDDEHVKIGRAHV